MAEDKAVGRITRLLDGKERVWYNIHSGVYGTNGIPDIITSDSKGILTGIEAKDITGKVEPNQMERGYNLIKSNNRFIAGYEDFSVDKMDNHELPKIVFEDVEMKTPKHTFELVLKEE